MFERFTERARQVVVLAQEEARALMHNYIGTEHILLALLREEDGVPAQVLEALGVTAKHVRTQVREIVGAGKEPSTGQIPFTPRAKKVLELALREALSLGHDDIGTEHILLGLIRENEGVAARILVDCNADSETIHTAVIRMLSKPGARTRAESIVTELPRRWVGIDQAWLGELSQALDRLATEIRDDLQRPPDTGDLLLTLACAPETLAGHALRELGVDLDGLRGVIQRLRTEVSPVEAELAQQIKDMARAKEQAIEAQEFETAARMRDQERQLRQQADARTALPYEVLQQVRRQLGLPDHPEKPADSPPTR